MPLILGTNSIKDTGYNVTNSLRFNESDDCLIKTFGSAGNRKLWTYSVWFKRGKLGGSYALFVAGASGGNDEGTIRIEADKIDWQNYDVGTSAQDGQLLTNQLIRDPSAWYHLVCAYDSANSTAGNRMRMYLNGSEVTSFATDNNPSVNYDSATNNAVVHNIGRQSWNSSADYSGYMTEICFIDGQALDPTSFGEFDEDSPLIWKPKAVSGLTFGNNGFYLEFKQSGTGTNASGIGADTSGNTNHFAVNNLTAVSQSTDTCTNNFCTLNPLARGPRVNYSESAGTFSEGNLNVLGTGTADDFAGTMAVSTGKWFYEVKLLTALNHGAGFVPLDDFTSGDSSIANGIINAAQQYGSHEGGSDSKIANNGDTSVSPQNNFADDDIISFAFDIDGGTLGIYRNGSLDRTISSIPADTYIPIGGDSSSTDASLSFNFGSPSYSESGGNSDGNGYGNFSMAVPSGYFALCTKNLAEYG